MKEASFTPDEFVGFVKDFVWGMRLDSELFGIWEKIWSAIDFMAPVIPFILLALSVVIGLFGKRIWSVLRFITYLFVGFILGTHLLGPAVSSVLPSVPAWAVGLIVGALAAVLSKVLHWIFLAASVEYSVYYFLCGAHILRFITEYTKGQYVISLIIATGFVVLTFFFLKYVEMAITSFAGGVGVALVIGHWVDYTSIAAFAERPYLPMLLTATLLAAGGMIFQIRTRKRYE